MERKDYEKIIKKHPRFTIKRDLKLKQEDNILKYIAKDIVKNDIIAFADETFSRNGKSGILIAKNAIYQDYKNAKIPFLNLQDVTYINKGKSSIDATFHYSDGQQLTHFMTVGENKDLFVDMIKEIAHKYNHSSEQKEEKKNLKQEEPKVVEETKTEVVKVVEETKKEEQVKEVSQQPNEREKSDVEKRLIEIYETQGIGAAYTPEVNDLVEAFKEELDEDLLLDRYALMIEKCESIKYFRYSEAHLMMADGYYYLNQYNQVMDCAKKINLNVVDKSEYEYQLYNIAYVLHEKEQYKEAFDFASASMAGGCEEAEEIIESAKENVDLSVLKKEEVPVANQKDNSPTITNKVEEKTIKETPKKEVVINQEKEIKIDENPVEETFQNKTINTQVENEIEEKQELKPTKKTLPSTKEKRIVIKNVHGLCETCERCIRNCPMEGALHIVDGIVEFVEKECIYCQLCVDLCRYGLIEIK